ncbi:hypothetical protein D9M72_590200 [compost metagenome]
MNGAQGNPAFLQDRQHLLVMAQLLARQARHEVHQVLVVAVLGDQRQRRAGGLELVVLVIDQQDFLVLQGGLHPRRRRRATEEIPDFRQHDSLHS